MKKIFIESIRSFRRHGVPRFSAAIAYYMIFCLAPLFVFALSILHLFLQDPSINMAFFSALKELFGRDSVGFLQENLQEPSSEMNLWLTFIGLFFGLLGAGAVFRELKCGLDTIFEAAIPQRTFWEILLRSILTFGTVIVIGLFLLVSLLSTMILIILGTYFQSTVFINTELVEFLNFGFSFFILTSFFMVLYTYVPDTKIPFRLTLFGSLVTAFLFTLGKTLFGLYLGTIGISSGYGAAGSILVLLVWIFYSAQIFFFGAEITAQIKKDKTILQRLL